MPGRIVGKTTDDRGREGFVLTLQTREQHIRRQTATSNICTSEALVALASTAYLTAVGPKGLAHVAELCYHKAHYAASQIDELPGYSLPFDSPLLPGIRSPVPQATHLRLTPPSSTPRSSAASTSATQSPTECSSAPQR